MDELTAGVLESLNTLKERTEAEQAEHEAAAAKAEDLVQAVSESIARIEDVHSGSEDRESDPPPASPPQAPAAASSNGDSPPDGDRPSPRERVEIVVDAVRELCRTGDGPRRGDIRRSVELNDYELTAGLKEAVNLRRIQKVGRGAHTHYVVREASAPVTPVAERKKPGLSEADQERGGTIQGKILNYLVTNDGASGPAIALGIGVSLNDIRPELTTLMREGEVRTVRKGGEITYSAVL